MIHGSLKVGDGSSAGYKPPTCMRKLFLEFSSTIVANVQSRIKMKHFYQLVLRGGMLTAVQYFQQNEEFPPKEY